MKAATYSYYDFIMPYMPTLSRKIRGGGEKKTEVFSPVEITGDLTSACHQYTFINNIPHQMSKYLEASYQFILKEEKKKDLNYNFSQEFFYFIF